MKRVGDAAFKIFVGGLVGATLFLTGTFSLSVYRGISWHNAQSKLEKENPQE